MKSLIILGLIVLICTVNGQKHDHKRNGTENGTKPSPMPSEFGDELIEINGNQLNPASVCLGKNSTDDKIICIVEIISRMQLEMAERRGMMNSWKGKSWMGTVGGSIVGLIILICAIRCCIRHRKWKRECNSEDRQNLIVCPKMNSIN